MLSKKNQTQQSDAGRKKETRQCELDNVRELVSYIRLVYNNFKTGNIKIIGSV